MMKAPSSVPSVAMLWLSLGTYQAKESIVGGWVVTLTAP